MTDKQIAERAVQIAARIMQRAGLCRYEDATKCRKALLPSERARCAFSIHDLLYKEVLQ